MSSRSRGERGGSERGRSSEGQRRTSLYVRNVSFDIKSDDIAKVFSRFGHIRDIYIPLDFYTKEPRGFAYVEFEHYRDARDAMDELDGYRLMDREIEVQFAEGDRKNPNTMRRKEHARNGGGGYGGGRGRYYSRSRSRSPPRRRGRYASRSRSPPRRSRRSSGERRSYSRSGSRGRDRSVSPRRSVSKEKRSRSPESRSPSRD